MTTPIRRDLLSMKVAWPFGAQVARDVYGPLSLKALAQAWPLPRRRAPSATLASSRAPSDRPRTVDGRNGNET